MNGHGTVFDREKPPNVVFILTDQWRASAAGYAGDPNVRSPHPDAPADESFYFWPALEYTHNWHTLPCYDNNDPGKKMQDGCNAYDRITCATGCIRRRQYPADETGAVIFNP